jgi:CDGSH-type Zn-finger protein
MEWKVERARRVLLCTCKQTNRPPICDNTHLTVRDDA